MANTPQPITTPTQQQPKPPYPDVANQQPGVINPVGSFDPKSPNFNAYQPGAYNVPAPVTPLVNNTQPTAPISLSDMSTPATPQPIGYNNVSDASVGMPAGMTQMQSSPGDNPGATQNQPLNYKTLDPTSKKVLGIAAPISAGLQAGQSVQPTTDATGAIAGAAGAGLAGAGEGALAGAAIGAMGGPIGAVGGAVIGGTVGLVSGGINAFVGLQQARNAQRRQDAQQRAINALQDKWFEQQRQDQMYMYNTNRGDTLEQLRYNRKVAAIQSQWAAMQQAQQMIQGMMAQNENYKQLFIQRGR